MRDVKRSDLIRNVPWKDLTAMRPEDGWRECAIILPWLGVSMAFLASSLWLLAVPCAFMFFLTALRLNHEAIHHNLGFGPAGHGRVMHGLSMLMLLSNHSVAFNHLRHHKHVGTNSDLEGKCGRMPGWKVLLYGPVFPLETHLCAWREGGLRMRRVMRKDAALNCVIPALALVPGLGFLWVWIALMVVAQCLTAFFAVWITHHGCADEDVLMARSQRNPLVNLVSYNMFFHLEHHLFPAVPVSRLPRLARRLDAAFPDVRARIKPVIGRVSRAHCD